MSPRSPQGPSSGNRDPLTVLYALTALLTIVSFIADRGRTLRGLRIALKRMLRIAPAFILMLILVSVVLFLFPEETIVRGLTSGGIWAATGIAGLLGSIALMPGFIAYPLCGVLRDHGIPFMVLSGFTTTLMMVGILSFPIEKAYLGTRVALIRNLLSLLIAVVVAICMGLYFGEIG